VVIKFPSPQYAEKNTYLVDGLGFSGTDIIALNDMEHMLVSDKKVKILKEAIVV
jgi:hypothetical protein